MRLIPRKPSMKKSAAARTTGKWIRRMKKSINPFYGKKGRGIRNPKRALYNKGYHRATQGVNPFSKGKGNRKRRSGSSGVSSSGIGLIFVMAIMIIVVKYFWIIGGLYVVLSLLINKNALNEKKTIICAVLTVFSLFCFAISASHREDRAEEKIQVIENNTADTQQETIDKESINQSNNVTNVSNSDEITADSPKETEVHEKKEEIHGNCIPRFVREYNSIARHPLGDAFSGIGDNAIRVCDMNEGVKIDLYNCDKGQALYKSGIWINIWPSRTSEEVAVEYFEDIVSVLLPNISQDEREEIIHAGTTEGEYRDYKRYETENAIVYYPYNIIVPSYH